MHDKGLSIRGPSRDHDVPPHFSPGGDYGIINQRGSVIGDAFHVIDDGVVVDAEANARLWALAPELLEVLEEFVHQVDVYSVVHVKIAESEIISDGAKKAALKHHDNLFVGIGMRPLAARAKMTIKAAKGELDDIL